MAPPPPTPPNKKDKKRASTTSPLNRATGSAPARTNIPRASPQRVPHSRSGSFSSYSHSTRSSPAASSGGGGGRLSTPRCPSLTPPPFRVFTSSNNSGGAPSSNRADSTNSDFHAFSIGMASSSGQEGSPFSQGQGTPSNASSATLVHVTTGSSTSSSQTSSFLIRRNQDSSPGMPDNSRYGPRTEFSGRSTNTAAFEENDRHADDKRYKRGRSDLP